MNEEYILIVFGSTHFAIKSESAIKKTDLSCRLIPTPGEIKAGCGLTMKINMMDKQAVITILEDKKIELEGIYYVIDSGKEKTIKKIDE